MNDLYSEIIKLKKVIRTGWKIRKVKGRLESDAEHVFSMIMLSLEIMSKNNLQLDQLKVLKMIAYHELCEIDVKDYTPFSKITKEEKFRKEYKCIKRISATYSMPEIESLWLEFMELKTPESIFVKSLDKYDAVKQAQCYEKNGFGVDGLYDEFRNSAKSIADQMDSYLEN